VKTHWYATHWKTMDSVNHKMTNLNSTSYGPTAVCHRLYSAVCKGTSASTTSRPAMNWPAKTTCSKTCRGCSTTRARKGSTSCRPPRSCPLTPPNSFPTCTSTTTSGTSSNPPTCPKARASRLLTSRQRYSTDPKWLWVNMWPTHC